MRLINDCADVQFNSDNTNKTSRCQYLFNLSTYLVHILNKYNIVNYAKMCFIQNYVSLEMIEKDFQF